jgi:hypothetical protein
VKDRGEFRGQTKSLVKRARVFSCTGSRQKPMSIDRRMVSFKVEAVPVTAGSAQPSLLEQDDRLHRWMRRRRPADERVLNRPKPVRTRIRENLLAANGIRLNGKRRLVL